MKIGSYSIFPVLLWIIFPFFPFLNFFASSLVRPEKLTRTRLRPDTAQLVQSTFRLKQGTRSPVTIHPHRASLCAEPVLNWPWNSLFAYSSSQLALNRHSILGWQSTIWFRILWVSYFIPAAGRVHTCPVLWEAGRLFAFCRNHWLVLGARAWGSWTRCARGGGGHSQAEREVDGWLETLFRRWVFLSRWDTHLHVTPFLTATLITPDVCVIACVGIWVCMCV